MTTFQSFWANFSTNFVTITPIYDLKNLFHKSWWFFKSILLIMLYLKSIVCFFEFLELKTSILGNFGPKIQNGRQDFRPKNFFYNFLNSSINSIHYLKFHNSSLIFKIQVIFSLFLLAAILKNIISPWYRMKKVKVRLFFISVYIYLLYMQNLAFL